jgi:ABC-2 type transport system ATP-binding protein
MCGLLKFSSGKVEIDRQEIRSSGNKVKKMIGLVPQEIALYPKLSVRENMAYFGQMHGLFGEKLKTNVDGLLEKLQLNKQADKQISRCSGGIKRRTNIAAGMIHQPQILILDEPTVGVDAQSRNLIFEYLKQLNNSGTTILYTTHYLDEAEELCTRVSIIDDGQIVESGSPKSLIKKHDGCNDLGDVFLKITGKALRE